MDFEIVLKTLIAEFGRLQIRYAAIGGFALGVLGAPRQTIDLDFLVHQDDLPKLHDVLAGLGYERVFYTMNVSQYRHEDKTWGSVDLIHAFREISLGMLARARNYPLSGGSQTIKAAEPEDVIGLKVQAMSNDQGRRSQETTDIERLMARYGADLDWDRLQEYYDLFGIGNEARQLRERFAGAK